MIPAKTANWGCTALLPAAISSTASRSASARWASQVSPAVIRHLSSRRSPVCEAASRARSMSPTALRDGTFWETAGDPEDTRRELRPGGGRRWHQRLGGGLLLPPESWAQKSRILIIENHDDFGGHARRNEFRVGNRLLLSNGGTQSIESPSEYSDVAKALLKDLGIQTKVFYKAYDQKTLLASGYGVLLRQANIRRGPSRARHGLAAWPEFLAKTPLPENVNEKLRGCTPRRKIICRGFRARKSRRAWQRSATRIS